MAVLIPSLNPPIFSKYGKKSTHLPKAEGNRWYVARIKTRQEKQFAWALHALRICYFLPMQAIRSKTNGIVHELIFPNFCFFCGEVGDLYRAFDTKRMFGILKTDDQIGFIDDLRQIAKVVQAGFRLDKTENVQVGRRVKFIHGTTLAGVEGYVDKRIKNRVWLRVPMGGYAPLETEVDSLEVI